MAAIDLCSDTSSTFNMSPRYSFSHDLSRTDNNVLSIDLPPPSFHSLSDTDFDFNLRQSTTTLDQHSSSADQLFSHGMIRSVQIKKDLVANNNSSSSSAKQKDQHHKSSDGITTKKTYIPPPPMPPPHTVHDRDDLKTTLESSENQKQNSSKSSSSFWRFKKSRSLNFGSGSGGYASSLCPLPLLSRSHSAGSASIDSSTKRNHPKSPNCHKHSSSPMNYQKPPLKKGVYGSYGSRPTLLHVPSPSLFGFGSLFSDGKVKNNKKASC